MNSELNQNLSKIIRALEGQGLKSTKIAHAIGYTTTTQLNNSIEGKSLISTKAVQGLIKNLNVNPIFLFLGKGDMFLKDESEIETLRRENREWIQRHNEVVKAVMAFYEIIKKLEKRNADLIDLSSAALKYSQGQKQEEKEKKDLKEPLIDNIDDLLQMAENKVENLFSYDMIKSVLGNSQVSRMTAEEKIRLSNNEPDSSVKQKKK